MDEQVNVINAEVLLRERGVDLSSEAMDDPGAFSSSVTATVVTDNDEVSATGTLFGNEMPRLVRLNNFRLEAYLDGELLIFRHADVPGIIGAIGTTCAKHSVNIAQMSVGRAGPQAGGTALGVLNLDAAPPPAAIEEIVAIDKIESATAVTLPDASFLPGWLQG